jgi:hypothetical protein
MRKNYLYLGFSIISGFLVGLLLVFSFTNIFKPKYVMIVVEGGNIYFGERSLFNPYKISHPVFVNVSQDGNLSLQRFSDAVWRPQDFIYFNPQKVIFWTYLKDDSQLIDFIKNKTRVLAPQNQPQSQQNITTSSTSTQNLGR